MENQIIHHLYRKKYRYRSQNVFRRILVLNGFSILLHRFIKTSSINVDILKLAFEKEQSTHERRNRGRNMIWYYPQISKNVKTNNVKKIYTYWINILVEIIIILRSGIVIIPKRVKVAWII